MHVHTCNIIYLGVRNDDNHRRITVERHPFFFACDVEERESGMNDIIYIYSCRSFSLSLPYRVFINPEQGGAASFTREDRTRAGREPTLGVSPLLAPNSLKLSQVRFKRTSLVTIRSCTHTHFARVSK